MRVHSICADPGIAPDGTKGASIHLRSLAAALGARGHDVTLFTRRPPADLAALEVPWRPLGDIERASPPDVVYERLSLGHLGGLDAARRWSRPFVLEVNAPLIDEARRYRPDAVAPNDAETERRLLREADLVLGVSDPLSAWIREQRGADNGVATVRNGYDPRRFQTPADVARQPATIAFLGHPKPWHGAISLPDILFALREQRVPVQLLVIGGGAGADALLARARELRIADRVRVTGSVSAAEASALLATATIGIAPYEPQPFFYFCPLKVIEYLAAGLPVVTTRQGDLPSIVGPGGVLVDVPTTSAWVDALLGLLLSPRHRLDLQRQGLEHARSLTWDAVAARLVARIAALDVPVSR